MNAAAPVRSNRDQPWGYVALFAVAYGMLCHFGHHPIALPGWMTSVWPAASLLLAALLLSPPQRWPIYLGVATVASVACNRVLHGLAWFPSILHAAINAAQAGGTAWFLFRLCGPVASLHRVRAVVVLLVGAALFTSVATALIARYVAPTLDADHIIIPRARWASHILGVSVITPLVVVWAPLLPRFREWSWQRAGEALALVVMAGFVLWLALGTSEKLGNLFPAPFLALLPVLVGAIRFGLPGATAMLGLVAGAVVATVGQGGGWPAGGSVFDRLATAQLFLIVTALTGLLLAAHVAEKDAATRRVSEGETRFRTLFEHSLDAIAAVREGRVILANPAFLELLRAPDVTTLAGRPLEDYVTPDDRLRLASALEQPRNELRPVRPVRLRARRADGSELPVEARFTACTLADGAATLASLDDLTERELAEREERRVNQALRVISACGRALLSAESESALFSEVCRIATQPAGYRGAWIGYVEHDEAKSIRPAGSAGLADGELERERFTWADTSGGQSAAGRCVREGRPVPDRDEAGKRGTCSLALPLIADGWVFGVLTLQSDEPLAFSSEEVVLLQQMADSLATSVRALRAREKQAESDAEIRRLLAEAESARIALLGILEDERLADEARQKSDERYRNAVFNSPIGMALVSADGQWIEVNPALCRMFGYAAEELLARPADEVTHPADRVAGIQRRLKLVAGDIEPYVIEKRYLHKSGRIVWVQQSVSLVAARGGGAPHLFCQIQDVTARKLAEDSLAGVAERLALALRASRFGVWRYNPQLQLTEWDTRMFAIFGFPPGAVVPPLAEILERVAEEDRERVRRSWTPSPACERAYAMRCRVVWPDGQVRHIDLQGIVHEDALGRPEWVIGVAGDITDIVQATSESERLRAQLQQARKMEALGTMAAGVAHDFNNLLTGINGFVELASTSLPPNHEATQLLQRATRGAVSARDLVRRILNFARSSNEQTRAVVDLVAVVRDTAPLIVAATPANISVAVAAECDAAPVLADSGQLQQILMNFCTNAAHAIGSRNGRIEIGVAVSTLGTSLQPHVPTGCKPGPHVRLWVSDNGSGMDEATRRRIFEPFFTTKKAGDGTGLGLAIVHDIAHAHDAGLEVASVPGCGSTFTLHFPLVDPGAAAAPRPNASAALAGAGQHVLVVDDETSVGLIVRLALQKSGYAPEVYASPRDAWTRFSAEPGRFQLLIIDQNMPEITGPLFIARARELAPSLPVIMMSGRFERGRDAVQPAGVVALKKPFELIDLLTTVASTLQPVAPPARASAGKSEK